MNRQEIFDRVKTHLLTQNARASNGTWCRYRTAEGLKCAIGCLILDEHYRPGIERAGVSSVAVQEALHKSGIEFYQGSEDEAFLHELQAIHDAHPVEQWPELLTNFAKQYKLKE